MKLLSLLTLGLGLAAAACTTDIRPCKQGERPIKDRQNPDCASCMPCNNFLEIPVCTGTDVPKFDEVTSCPSCKVEKPIQCDRNTCTEDPKECTEDMKPELDRDTCCLTCSLPVKPTCTDDEIMTCKKTTFPTLPVCAAGERGVFDQDACCYTCRHEVKEPVTNPDECNREKFEACLQDVRRVCDVDEPPMRVPGQCCNSCSRPEREVPVTDVGRCADQVPVCKPGERKTAITDLAGNWQCPSCKPMRPKCDGKCTEKQVCVSDKTNPAGVCKDKRVIDVILRSDDADSKDFIKTSTADATKEAITEIVRRFCDKLENEVKCAEKKQELLDSLDCKKDRMSDVEAKVEISVSEKGRELLDEAMKDDEARGSITLGEEDKKCDIVNLKSLATCPVDVRPTKPMEGFCPSCLPTPFDKPRCELVRCAKPVECTADQRPSKVNCCLSCLPKKPMCTPETIKKCKASMATLPVCKTPIQGETLAMSSQLFDRDTCCPKCQRPKPTLPPVTCTKDDFKQCMNATRICEADEKPMKEDGMCCHTCFRKARLAPLRDVAKCGEIAECTDAIVGRPVFVRGDNNTFTCPTCKPAKPACDPKCDDKSVCVPSGSDEANVCKKKKVIAVKIRSVVAATQTYLKTASADEIKEMVKEVVRRFCDKTENDARCALFKEKLLATIKVTIKPSTGDNVEVEVETVEDETRRRRILADGASSLLEDAMADEEATGEVTMGDDTAPPTPPNESGASSVMGAVSALALVAASVMLA